MGRFLNRYPSTNVPVFGLGVLIYGFLLLVGSKAPFQAPVYQYVFATIPRPAWAAAFMVAGVGALIWVNLTSAMLLTFVITLWAANWLVAAIAHPHAVPTFSPVLVASVALALTISVARRGASRRMGIQPQLRGAIAAAELHAAAYGRLDTTAKNLERLAEALRTLVEEQ